MGKPVGGLSRRAFIGGAASVAAIGLPMPAISAGRDAKLAKAIAAFRSLYPNAAISVAVGDRGRMLYANAFGDARPGVAVTPAHKFRIASITKPITAATVMRLVEMGQLNLTDRVLGPNGILGARYPLASDAPQPEWREAITLDHLLTHTCGGWTNDRYDPMFKPPTMTQDEVIRLTLDTDSLDTAPGTKYAYSNFGYCLVGRVIEVVTGKSYAQAAMDLILGGTGGNTMRIGGSRSDELADDEVAYLPTDGRSPYVMNVPRMDSHGGWIGTPQQLVRFAMAVDGDRTIPDVIGQPSVSTMRRPSAVNSGYGRGWAVSPKHANRWHTGALPGLSSQLVLVPGGRAFAACANIRDEASLDALNKAMWGVYYAVT
jgi:CubicO group peptidase (beta-lactamase class C family)